MWLKLCTIGQWMIWRFMCWLCYLHRPIAKQGYLLYVYRRKMSQFWSFSILKRWELLPTCVTKLWKLISVHEMQCEICTHSYYIQHFKILLVDLWKHLLWFQYYQAYDQSNSVVFNNKTKSFKKSSLIVHKNSFATSLSLCFIKLP